MANKKYTFIDLFAGCGGLSEGFYKEGFKALAHVEIDKYCCSTLRERMKYYGYSQNDIDKSVIESDIKADNIINRIEYAVGKSEVDMIIGGPPCQAYSSAGRARDENGMKNDPRNYLFEHYVKILNHFKPKFFVFENVTGLLTTNIDGIKILQLVFAALKKNFKIVEQPSTLLFNTANYGVPQIRKRLIIIGVRKDLDLRPEEIYESLKITHYDPDMSEEDSRKLKKYVSVADAIGDLPIIHAGQKIKELSYNSKESNDYLSWVRSEGETLVFDHITRTQNEKDTERYSEMAKNHWTFEQLLENRPDLNHEKKRVFNNSYTCLLYTSDAADEL